MEVLNANDGYGARLCRVIGTEFSKYVSNRMMTYKEPETEYTHEQNLLRPLQVQTLQNRKWQDEDGDIRDDVAGGVDVPKWEVRNAGSGDCVVPELVDRRTVEYDNQKL